MIRNGDILGGMYQIIGEIGQGGTGIIYLAEHLRLRKQVVVKKIKDHFAGQVNGRAEVDILKRLHHTCLPQVYDFLVIDNSVYTVMEYVDGYDLQHYLDQQYHFPEHLLRQWLLQLSEVLAYLHSQNPPIIHSDIKPANLMVTRDKSICLIDFNISLDGEISKDVQGISPWYAAPEQSERAKEVLAGKKVGIKLDGRMDIYSLGATFYRVMTGVLPTPDRPVQDIMEMDIPYCDGMKAVVAKAMQRNPAARFQTAAQMNKALADVVRMDPVYRRCGYMQAAGVLVWVLLMIAGVLLVYYGNWQNGVEKWNEAYRQLYISAEAQDETEIVSQAVTMLNESSYRGYLERNDEQKAKVLYILGESYFRQGNFSDAAECYGEAWELFPEEVGYCRDYVIALVRDGQGSKARRVMESPEGKKSLSASEMYLVLAELAWQNQDKKEAFSALDELIDATEGSSGKTDQEARQKGYLLAAAIYEDEENYGQAAEVLEKAQEIFFSRDILREMGRTASNAAQQERREAVKKSYLQKALECYQALKVLNDPSFEDRMNLALVERALGDYEGSNADLRELLYDYPEDYRIPMWMCYNYLDIAGEERSYDNVEDELTYRYRDCKYLYDISGKTDSDMETLMECMEELEG